MTFRVGLKSISIPSPSNEMAEIGSDYRVMLETLAPASNRLVAAFIRPEDVSQVISGGKTPLPRYALVEIPRRAEFVDVDPSTFKTVADGVGQQFGAALGANIKKATDELNQKLKDMDSNPTTVTIDKPLPLGALFSKPDSVAFAMIESVASGGPATKMLVGMVVLRVQSRVVFLYLYSIYKDETTVDWMRTTSDHWADAILAANKQ